MNGLRTLWYRIKYQWVLRKARFGPGTSIRCRLEIVGPGRVRTGAGVRFEADPWGYDHVTIYFSGRDAEVTLGDGVTLRGTRIGSQLSVTVLDGATVEACSLFDTDYHHVDATKRHEDVSETNRPVVVGAGSYIGLDAICSKGTTLGEGVVLLPGTVIGTKRIPDGVRVWGNPGRVSTVRSDKALND